MNLNKAFILGRLTRDPQVRSLPSGQLVANFGLATNRFFYDQQGNKKEQAEFHNIVAFGRQAEIIQQYLKQGSIALIEGRLQTRSWEDKNGIKKYRTEIIVQNLQLGPKGQNMPTETQKPTNGSKEVKKEDIPIIEEDEGEIDVKDLPL